MSQFAIVLSEGWTETMYETMRAAAESEEFSFYFYFIQFYLIFSHFFCSLILLSLFVAVILDNLELDEDVKKIKQLKAREQSAETQKKLPLRLRVFEKFPNHPQMVSLKRVNNDFDVPKIRESFMRQFLGDEFNIVEETSFNNNNANSMQNENETENKIIKSSSIKIIRPKIGSTLNKLPSIIENPNSSVNLTSQNKTVVNLTDVNNSNMLQNRKITTSNAQAAKFRILNNIRMQRAGRFSMKKMAINNIIQKSNNQRLFNSGNNSNETGQNMTQIVGFMPDQNLNAGDVSIAQKRINRNRDKSKNVSSVNGAIAGVKANTAAAASSSNKQQQRTNPMFNQVPGASGAPSGGNIDFKIFQYKKQQAELKRNQLEDDLKENHPYFDKPLFTIGRESNFRKFCQMIVEARYNRRKLVRNDLTSASATAKDKYKKFYKFLGLVSYLDWIMIAVTIQSCIGMMFESPTRRLVEVWQLKIVEYLFVLFMSIEITLKVCAYGFFFTPNAVIKDFGGILDLFIFSVSLVFLYLSPEEVGVNSGAQILMLLRCLRPLRIFTLVPHMRKVIYELCKGFKEILLVSILIVAFIFVFANYGIQIFGGRLARCNDVKMIEKKSCTGIYKRNVFVTKLKLAKKNNVTPAIWVPRVWANPYNFNFDSIGSAMLTLFEVLSLEGWLEVRDVIIERMGTRHAVFVHVFVFIGTMIGLTLFVGVVITNYSENKGTALLTVDQRRWLDLKGRIKLSQPLHIPPRPDNSPFRAFIFDITQNKKFKRFSAFIVLLNCALLSIPWKVEDTATNVLATLAALFTLLFLFEAIMKVCALGFMGYRQSTRNIADFIITLLGLIWIIMHFSSFSKKEIRETSNSFGFVVIVLRFFTITGKHATLKMLMLTILNSIFKSFFIIIGMFLLILVYAFAGVILFGSVKSGHDLGRQANFRSSTDAIILLARIITGEEWNKIMHDCMVAPPACTKGKNYWESDCGSYAAALLYFCTFYIVITYIVLNLLVAIIMENFSLFYSNEEDALLSYSDIRHFQIVWNIVDTNRKGLIPCRRVKFLLRLLRGRLEVDLEKDRLLFKHMCYEIEHLNNGGDVTFHDVLSMLSYRSVDIRKSLKLEELLAREELEYQIEEEVAKLTIRNWLDSCLRRMREKGKITLQKSMNKQNDIAIFKEQLGARSLLTQNRMAITAQNVAIGTQGSNNPELQYTQLEYKLTPSGNLSSDLNEQLKRSPKQMTNFEKRISPIPTPDQTARDPLNRTMSATSNKFETTETNFNIKSSQNESYKSSKKKKKNLERQSIPVNNEERHKKRSLLILESKSMSNEVKTWWSNILNDIEF